MKEYKNIEEVKEVKSKPEINKVSTKILNETIPVPQKQQKQLRTEIYSKLTEGSSLNTTRHKES